MYPHLIDSITVQPHSLVLDVGGGCWGVWEAVEGRLHASGRAVLLDLNESDLRKARPSRGFDPRLQTVLADAASLPIRTGSADGVTCCKVLIYVPDPARAIGEFARVLRPGGWLCQCEPVPALLRETEGFDWGRWTAIHQAIREMREASLVDPPFRAGMDLREERLVHLLQESGLEIVKTETEIVPKIELGGPEAVLRMWKPPHLQYLWPEEVRLWHERLIERFSPEAVDAFARFATEAVQCGQLELTLPLLYLWSRKPD